MLTVACGTNSDGYQSRPGSKPAIPHHRANLPRGDSQYGGHGVLGGYFDRFAYSANQAGYRALSLRGPERVTIVPGYRILFVNAKSRASRASEFFECADDQEAIQKAVQFIDGQDVELWIGARLVARFPHDDS
jgi:hypothetical protein